ncbi:MAG: ATP-binding protein [Desulfobulbaceae bacterium]|nr:ATP-binding protein [Desulfobulbaceae bacterium]
MPKSKILYFLGALSIASVLFIPLFNFIYLYPAVDRLLVSDAELRAKRVANHFSSFFQDSGNNLTKSDITPELAGELEDVVLDFSLEKIKVFSDTGEVLYSTDIYDIGQINTNEYFESLVLRGKNFTKIVRKDTRSMEGRLLRFDVIETYVPIWGNDRIIGAFEIYYDITELKERYNSLFLLSSKIIYPVTLLVLAALLFILFIFSRDLRARVRAEKKLNRQNDELRQQFEEKTAEWGAEKERLQKKLQQCGKAEQDLINTLENSRTLIEMAADPIIIADAETKTISSINKRGTQLIGYEEKEVIGLPVSELLTKNGTDLLQNPPGTTEDYCFPPDQLLYLRHKSGRRIPVEAHISLLDLQGTKIIQGIFRDITVRRQAAEEEQIKQKLKAVSCFAATFARDLDSCLTAASKNLAFVREAEEAPELRQHIADAERFIGRTRIFAEQLLVLADIERPVKKPVALAEVIEKSMHSIFHGTRVQGTFSLLPGLWQIDADPVQMRQVMNNLLVNALQAMPQGGSCEITAGNETVAEGNEMQLPPGRFIRVLVRDDGIGIPKNKIDRIFDPFYTTKEKGCGLGLSIVRTVITHHGGGIFVSSEYGVGTTFTLYLPASPPETPEVKTLGPDQDEPE